MRQSANLRNNKSARTNSSEVKLKSKRENSTDSKSGLDEFVRSKTKV